jgi:molybdate transport system ATP-binding protein
VTGNLHLRAVVADRGFDVELTVQPGEVVAVLGPNGAGKSTLLSLVAGLLRPDPGRITLDDQILVDAGTFRPPHRRAVALLAQHALLFPHLTAVDNVSFGPRSSGLPRREAAAVARNWLNAVDALPLADRRPAQLSGGQQQRVAVARALAADPHLLLLDEPMAALDVGAAPALRQLLRRVLRGTDGDRPRSGLLVTHDVLDALMLADRVVVLDAGRIVEQGPVRDVLRAPRSAFAARIAGINLLTGTATEHGLRTRDGLHVIGRLDPDTSRDTPAVAVFSPSAVAVHDSVPSGSPRNAFVVRIGELEPRGELVRVHATTGLSADITVGSVADLDLHPGREAWFAVKATEVAVYPAGRARQPSPGPG